MSNILTKIINHKKAELSAKKEYYQKLEKDFENGDLRVSKDGKKTSFFSALKGTDSRTIKLIAEIKKASPSKGEIFPQADILRLAEIYEQNGASAISVLSDETFFQGHIQDVASVSQKMKIPVLRKDFILEKGQILEAKIYGASAVLLMVSVLKTTSKIKALLAYANSLNLECLVETHDEAEIEKAVSAGAQIIGVNSRNFVDLSVDLDRLPPLLEKIPSKIVRVAESGIRSTEDILKIKPFCDAVLVGTSFMQTQDYEAIKNLVNQFTKYTKYH